jgi:preprotein translocase subunit YajC
VSIATLIPLILIVGVMFMMTRSAKNKQRQQQSMRNTMTPGAGVRTIGGLYGRVVEVHDESVQLEIDEDVQVHFAKNAIAAVLDTAEYERIVNRVEPAAEDDAAVEAEDADDTAAVDETAEAEAVESVEEPEDVKDAAEGEGKKDPESVSK